MAECCTAAHNLEIVTRLLNEARDENKVLRERVRKLEAFRRLTYRLAGEDPPDA